MVAPLLVAAIALSPRASARPVEEVPAGFMAMEVALVSPMDDGAHVVFLADEDVVIPINVGPTEALAIALRSDAQTFGRPLTVDLLDGVLHHVKGRVVAVHITALEDEVFAASVVIKRPLRKAFVLDARASDAIALALGHAVPIAVAEPVRGEAGVSRRSLARQDPPLTT